MFLNLRAASLSTNPALSRARMRMNRRTPPSRRSMTRRDLLLIATARRFHRLGLCRRWRLANFLGAPCSIQRGLRVTLELRHDLARDKFVAAQRGLRVRPVMRQHQVGAE